MDKKQDQHPYHSSQPIFLTEKRWKNELVKLQQISTTTSKAKKENSEVK